MNSDNLKERIVKLMATFEYGYRDDEVDQLLQLFQDYCEGCVPEELLLTSQTGRDMKQLVAFGYNMCRQAMLDKLEDKS